MELTAIEKQSIPQNIIRQLVSLIAARQLKTGDRLPSERELSGIFGVSRASVREALSALCILGVVEIRQGSGAYVAELEIADFFQAVSPLLLNRTNPAELMAFRSMLEREAAVLCLRNAAQKGLLDAELGRIRRGMLKAAEKDDADAGRQLDMELHQVMFRYCGNYFVSAIRESLSVLLDRAVETYRGIINADGKSAELLYKYHMELIEALLQSDEGGALKALEGHFGLVFEQIDQKTQHPDGHL